MKAKFQIDLKKLETGEPVQICKDLYARKLTDSIEIYGIRPVEFTPKEDESISKAVRVGDWLYELLNWLSELLKEKLVPIEFLANSLYEKYCENCLECDESSDACELWYLRGHICSGIGDMTDTLDEFHKEHRRKRKEAEGR